MRSGSRRRWRGSARRRGGTSASLDELVGAGMVPGIPPDPFGGHYVWDPTERKVRSSVNPFRFRLKEGPRDPRFQYQPPQPAPEKAPP